MKFCRDCKNYKAPDFCYSPKNGYDLVTGEVKPKIASYCRSDNQILTSGCGTDASYFIPKIDYTPIIKTKKRWWNRFL